MNREKKWSFILKAVIIIGIAVCIGIIGVLIYKKFKIPKISVTFENQKEITAITGDTSKTRKYTNTIKYNNLKSGDTYTVIYMLIEDVQYPSNVEKKILQTKSVNFTPIKTDGEIKVDLFLPINDFSILKANGITMTFSVKDRHGKYVIKGEVVE